MIKASFLQKQATKYRELARGEVSLEMRRQLFALASRCDELATTMARWPGPKDLVRPPAAAEAPREARPLRDAKPSAPAPAPTLRFPEGPRARVVHGFAD